MKHKDYTVYLLLGGNEGEVKDIFEQVRKDLSRISNEQNASSLYRTAAWGMDRAPDFLNQALQIETALEPLELLQQLLLLEAAYGRKKRMKANGKYASRPLDIDILLWDQQVIDTPALQIPHPRMHQRRFTLMPLAEIAPYIKHPIFKQTVAQLLELCPDTLEVEKL